MSARIAPLFIPETLCAHAQLHTQIPHSIPHTHSTQHTCISLYIWILICFSNGSGNKMDFQCGAAAPSGHPPHSLSLSLSISLNCMESLILPTQRCWWCSFVSRGQQGGQSLLHTQKQRRSRITSVWGVCFPFHQAYSTNLFSLFGNFCTSRSRMRWVCVWCMCVSPDEQQSAFIHLLFGLLFIANVQNDDEDTQKFETSTDMEHGAKLLNSRRIAVSQISSSQWNIIFASEKQHLAQQMTTTSFSMFSMSYPCDGSATAFFILFFIGEKMRWAAER